MREKHIRRFIGLSTLIFILVSVGHTLRIVYSWDIAIGGVSFSPHFSYLTLLILVCMVVMGVYYLRK